MTRFEGKSALVTGAARGQGRSHAVALAREGADVAVCDICTDIGSIPYSLGTEADLDETVRLIEAEGRRAVRGVVDVRSGDQIRGFAEQAVGELGKLDVLVANAGIFASAAFLHELEEDVFDDMIAVNLKGVWLTIKAVVPHMIERKYGRIVVTGSTAGLIGAPHFGHYCASKHALDGLVKTLALEQGANGITANIVAPTGVGTTMILNETLYGIFNEAEPTKDAMAEIMKTLHAIPRPWLEPEDVTPVVLFLASDDAQYTTGSIYKVDMGWDGVVVAAMTRKVRAVVAGDDGKTRFEERELELHLVEDMTPGGAFEAASLGASDVALVRFAPGYDVGFHHTPTPTWMFVMKGRLRLGLSDDVWAELVPGDIVYMTDADGEGHRSRVLGDEEVLLATAGFGG